MLIFAHGDQGFIFKIMHKNCTVDPPARTHRMDKAARDNRSRQLNPRDRQYHLGRDNNRANQLNPNNEQYWRARGGSPAASEGRGWSSLLTVVGVVAAAVVAVGAAASAVYKKKESQEEDPEDA